MKFGQTLKYNSVADWAPLYCSYDQLKKLLDGIRVLRTRLFYADDPSADAASAYDAASQHDATDSSSEDDDDGRDNAHLEEMEDRDAASPMTPRRGRRRRGRRAGGGRSGGGGGGGRGGSCDGSGVARAGGEDYGDGDGDEFGGDRYSGMRVNRSASQAVLHDLNTPRMESGGGCSGTAVGGAGLRLGGGRVGAPPRPPALLASSVSPRVLGGSDLEEGLSKRDLQARLEAVEQQFFDKVAAEADKVDQFYSKMMVLLPKYSHAHEQRVVQLFGIDVGRDLEQGGGGGGAEDSWDDLPEADDRTPLIGPEASAAASAVASASASGLNAADGVGAARLAPPPPAFRGRGVETAAARERLAASRRAEEVATLRARLCNHYLDIVGMINFSKLNWSAFDKILKKHDKIAGKSTREAYMEGLRRTRTFPDSTAVEQLRDATEALFAKAYWKGDVQAAKEELLEGVREQIIWSRNTVWRDMLRIERKVAAFRSKPSGKGALQGGDIVVTAKGYPICIGLVLFALILLFPGIVYALPVPGGAEYTDDTLSAAHRCLAMLSLVVVLWAQDGLPLYITGFIVLPGTVLLRLLLDKHGVPLASHAASEEVFHSLSSSTLMLIICVYTLHAALSKFQIDKKLASEVLSRIQSPEWLLLAVMILAVLMSMLVSNVASPVLLNSIVLPVLRDVPRSGRPFVQCILVGIAVASNIGGMPSPISSPQNAVALGLLKAKYDVPFMEWLKITLPLCAMMVTLCFLLLVLWYKPQRYRLPKVPVHKERFRLPHYVVIGTVAVTVLLWSWHRATDAFGSAGMVAVLPVIVFYGSGLLNKEDFNNLPWDVVYLVAGGIVLGNAVSSSRLLDLVAGRLHHLLGNAPVWAAFAVFSTFMAVVANMVSHTVSAIIVLPVIMEVGAAMGHPRLLVMGGVLACSGAMALPVSSFPNMAALGVMSDLGEPFLTSVDLLRVGIPMTAICSAVVLVCGYPWMKSFGY